MDLMLTLKTFKKIFWIEIYMAEYITGIGNSTDKALPWCGLIWPLYKAIATILNTRGRGCIFLPEWVQGVDLDF